ncbi:hypothetical protein [Arthrobacter sp. RAF14]
MRIRMAWERSHVAELMGRKSLAVVTEAAMAEPVNSASQTNA